MVMGGGDSSVKEWRREKQFVEGLTEKREECEEREREGREEGRAEVKG